MNAQPEEPIHMAILAFYAAYPTITHMHRASPSHLSKEPAAPSTPQTATQTATPASAERRLSRAERRRSQRRQVVVAVRQEVVATPATPAELHLAQSSDLGLGGMRVWRHCGSDEPELPTHTPVRLAFQLPDDMQLLEVDGEVVFDRSPGQKSSEDGGQRYRATGVRFSEVDEAVLSRLRDFLDD